MPTLNELYRPFRVGNDATAANALLSPERLTGIEGGVTLAPAPRTHQGTFGSDGTVTGMFPTDRLLGATVTIPSNAQGVTLPSGTTVQSVVQAYVAPTSNPPTPGKPGIIELSAKPTALPAVNQNFGTQFLCALTGNGIVATGADAAAVFTGASVNFVATVQLERSFDGGLTWIVCNLGSAGTLAQWNGGGPIGLTFGEPERQVAYRFNCIAYTSGTINYRISQTGGADESLAIGPLTGG